MAKLKTYMDEALNLIQQSDKLEKDLQLVNQKIRTENSKIVTKINQLTLVDELIELTPFVFNIQQELGVIQIKFIDQQDERNIPIGLHLDYKKGEFMLDTAIYDPQSRSFINQTQDNINEETKDIIIKHYVEPIFKEFEIDFEEKPMFA